MKSSRSTQKRNYRPQTPQCGGWGAKGKGGPLSLGKRNFSTRP